MTTTRTVKVSDSHPGAIARKLNALTWMVEVSGMGVGTVDWSQDDSEWCAMRSLSASGPLALGASRDFSEAVRMVAQAAA